MKRPKRLEDENGRLRKIAADLTLDRELRAFAAIGPRTMAGGRDPAKDPSPAGPNRWCLLADPGRLREGVRGMCSEGAVSVRAACGAIGSDRSTFHYQSRRTDQAAMAKRIRRFARHG
jgi:hypothetical protein